MVIFEVVTAFGCAFCAGYGVKVLGRVWVMDGVFVSGFGMNLSVDMYVVVWWLDEMICTCIFVELGCVVD